VDKVHRLQRTQLIEKPLPEVFAFFSAPENLQRLTPAFLNFSITTPLPIAMAVGTQIDYALSLWGLPVRWKTRIDRYEPGVLFSDVALRSPYKSWHHLHVFKATAGGTQMDDIVDYELPLGPLGAIAHVALVKRTLDTIFDYRAQAVQRWCDETRNGFNVPSEPERQAI